MNIIHSIVHEQLPDTLQVFYFAKNGLLEIVTTQGLTMALFLLTQLLALFPDTIRPK
jgi:hypothetical protein